MPAASRPQMLRAVFSQCFLLLLSMCAATAAGALELRWQSPTGGAGWTNVDGSATDDLAGFRAECAGATYDLPSTDTALRSWALPLTLAPGQSVTCRLLAYDEAGQTSRWSNTVTALGVTAPDGEPAAPLILCGECTAPARWIVAPNRTYPTRPLYHAPPIWPTRDEIGRAEVGADCGALVEPSAFGRTWREHRGGVVLCEIAEP
jgi:hypothetical protein